MIIFSSNVNGMKIQDITNYLESIAPLSTQEHYDNSGLIVGDPKRTVRKALICLDSTEEVLKEAKRRKCDLVIAHHPIVFSGMKRFNGTDYVQRAIMYAIKNDIAIYAIHTNLDNSRMGVNKKIADKLGLKDLQILSPMQGQLKKLVVFCPEQQASKVRKAMGDAGAGTIGEYDHCSFSLQGDGRFRANNGSKPYVGKKGEVHTEAEERIEVIYEAHHERAVLNAMLRAHPYEEVAHDIYSLDNVQPYRGAGMVGELKRPLKEKEFLATVKRRMKSGVIKHSNLLGNKVMRVAICGGSGSFLLPAAIAAGADMFITSDYKYHQFFDAEDRIVIADIGHYESEQFTIQLLGDLLREKFPKFALHFTEVNTNPINYL